MARLQHKRTLCCRPRGLLFLTMLLSLSNLWKVVSCQGIGRDGDAEHAEAHQKRAPAPRNCRPLTACCKQAAAAAVLIGLQICMST